MRHTHIHIHIINQYDDDNLWVVGDNEQPKKKSRNSKNRL